MSKPGTILCSKLQKDLNFCAKVNHCEKKKKTDTKQMKASYKKTVTKSGLKKEGERGRLQV